MEQYFKYVFFRAIKIFIATLHLIQFHFSQVILISSLGVGMCCFIIAINLNEIMIINSFIIEMRVINIISSLTGIKVADYNLIGKEGCCLLNINGNRCNFVAFFAISIIKMFYFTKCCYE